MHFPALETGLEGCHLYLDCFDWQILRSHSAAKAGSANILRRYRLPPPR